MKNSIPIILSFLIIAISIYLENNYEAVDLLFFRILSFIIAFYYTGKILIGYMLKDEEDVNHKKNPQSTKFKDERNTKKILTCHKCNAKHYYTSNFCHLCGAKLRK